MTTKTQKIAILGAAESGVGAAILATQQGFDVWVSDYSQIQPKHKECLNKYNINWEEGNHSEEAILDAHLVMKSPGIPENADIIQKIRKKGIAVVSEIEFASRYTDAFIIAITGSNGKTTATSLTYKILKDAGLNVGVAGNIGVSFAQQVATQQFDYYVLEVSSFQLDDIDSFKPNISVLLNITPDHLDRYDYKFENYLAAKFKITQNQNDDNLFIYCQDDKSIASSLITKKIHAQSIPFTLENEVGEGAYLQNNELTINLKKKVFTMSINEIGIKGKHNIYNSMAASIVARAVDIKKESIRESLADFKNLEHRMEKVLKIGGVEFINDSKATNVNSTWYALESIQNPVVWIAGGVDKGNDYEVLKSLVRAKVHTVICLGNDSRNLHEAFSHQTDLMINVHDMKEAVRIANHFANKGDAVLLSPACASFDLFENYEDRGNQFKESVRNL
ncbi:MAG: UDP-N-acetylmuramoyl-L-alanine--D-glutamate ligase [Chitinophagales bacterium]|nr:UDP-N-acetylmuramoyl-L-alanine--D-glutamate ligase [Chitinophagales bacterium]